MSRTAKHMQNNGWLASIQSIVEIERAAHAVLPLSFGVCTYCLLKRENPDHRRMSHSS